MKHLLLTTIAAVLVVGCGESQQSAPAPESKPEPPTAKAPDISIHDAVDKGNAEAIKQHLAAGTDVNAKNEWGGTPLHFAATKEMVELLIAKGADVNAKNKYGSTPLHRAASGGHKEIAGILIAKGADVNAKENHGRTPLHGAAFHGHKEVVELLITQGADVNAKNEDVETPLDRAIRNNLNISTETADLLRKHGGKTGEELKTEGK